MHDPMSVAWELRLPLPWKEPKTYRARDGSLQPARFVGGKRRWRSLRLVTIWHNDPCTDGTDDSCNLGRRAVRKHKGLLECAGADEARSPWFQRERAKVPQSPADAECLLRGALWDMARMLRLDRWSIHHKRLTFADCTQLACDLLHNTVDNVRTTLCLLPGWHTNEPMPDGTYPPEIDIEDDEAHDAETRRPVTDARYPQDTSEWKRKELATRFFGMCARILTRHTARWWQSWRWHFWHWSFQVHPWQQLRRRWWERCDICHQRLKGGTTYSDWHGTRRWCEACDAKQSRPQQETQEAKA